MFIYGRSLQCQRFGTLRDEMDALRFLCKELLNEPYFLKGEQCNNKIINRDYNFGKYRDTKISISTQKLRL